MVFEDPTVVAAGSAAGGGNPLWNRVLWLYTKAGDGVKRVFGKSWDGVKNVFGQASTVFFAVAAGSDYHPHWSVSLPIALSIGGITLFFALKKLVVAEASCGALLLSVALVYFVYEPKRLESWKGFLENMSSFLETALAIATLVRAFPIIHSVRNYVRARVAKGRGK